MAFSLTCYQLLTRLLWCGAWFTLDDTRPRQIWDRLVIYQKVHGRKENLGGSRMRRGMHQLVCYFVVLTYLTWWSVATKGVSSSDWYIQLPPDLPKGVRISAPRSKTLSRKPGHRYLQYLDIHVVKDTDLKLDVLVSTDGNIRACGAEPVVNHMCLNIVICISFRSVFSQIHLL